MADMIAGVDAAYSASQQCAVAAAVVWHVVQQCVVELHWAVQRCPAPYVPGRFAEREAPVTLAAVAALRVRPDVLLCDAHGRAHPQRWGLACELASRLGYPTVGCAKTLLCGIHVAPAQERGAWAEIVDGSELLGRAVRTRAGVRPVFVSVGGGIDLDAAVQWVLRAAPRFRIPEPLRVAHQQAAKVLSGLVGGSCT